MLPGCRCSLDVGVLCLCLPTGTADLTIWYCVCIPVRLQKILGSQLWLSIIPSPQWFLQSFTTWPHSLPGKDHCPDPELDISLFWDLGAIFPPFTSWLLYSKVIFKPSRLSSLPYLAANPHQMLLYFYVLLASSGFCLFP